ncbi:hypothetical protein [Cohaesibacter haloalkalitolerans]|uniref:hypothetical protein n=1 Tax=Cohaesibacter haloalkalitolerans TaxID=1162980 RepID=UPI001968B006|nr:hypothetical protein [Cohaesibacter haloalkalitolerans]
MFRTIGAVSVLTLMVGTMAVKAETLKFAYASNATPTVEAMKKFGEILEQKPTVT